MLQYTGYILTGVIGTVTITVSAFLIGAVLGVPLAVASRSTSRLLRWPAVSLIEVFRSVPNLVWLFLVFFGLPEVGIRLGPWTTAILTLGVTSSAYLGEIYRGGFSALGQGQWLASKALGLTTWDRGRYVLAPQLIRVVSPTMATYAISLLKESALASTIGVMELTFRGGLVTQRTGDGLSTFVVVGVVYLLLSLPLAYGSRRVDSRLRAKFSVG
ncbi:amino acid ABC transporter permease [Dactylosporangium sp. CA-233914]|uniref:amino acid ABC transporter permease n=1 Tax=Dactylosporangium sp. CA-233914 TaxID=3239934 RepID=UPI003D93AB90